MNKPTNKATLNSPLGVGGRYYSTNNTSLTVSLQEAVIKGLADDKGLFMPEKIERLPNVNEEIETEVTIVQEFLGVTLVEIVSKCKGEMISKGELKTVIAK